MKTKRLSYLIVSIILAFCASMLVLTSTAPTKANADTSTTVFSMVDGASVKINNDGGVRWKVKMDQETKDSIVNSDNVSLKFIVTYADFFERVTDDKYYETLTGGENKRAYIIPVDEAKIYKMGDLYYANACITAFTEGYADNYVALAVIDNANSYTYATVNGLGVEDENFSINRTKTNLYGLLNLAVLDTTDDYATSIFECSAYENWFGTESYPVKISDVNAYDGLLTNINKGISYGSVQVEIADTVDTSEATVELDQDKQLPSNTYAIRTVNFYAEDKETLIDTVSVKDYGQGAVASTSEVPTKESTVSTVYSFDAWVKADGSTANLGVVTESMDVYPSFNESVREYTITWNDENGNLIKTTQAPYGFEPYFDGTVTKESEGIEVYEFAGWSPALESVTGDATYQATFGVKDTLVLSENTVADYLTFSRVTDAEKVPEGYEYAWEVYAEGDAIGNFNMYATINGNFKAGTSYRITINGVWPYGQNGTNGLFHVMYDGGSKSALMLGDGWIIEQKFAEDTTELVLDLWIRTRGGGENDVAFSGEDSICMSAKVEEIVYKTVNWESRGVIIDTQQVEVGLIPEFTGTIEAYEEDGVMKAFSGWDKEITAVIEDVTYVAQFTNAYLISWYGYNDTLIYSEYVAEGVAPEFDESKLTSEHMKPADGMTVYEISGWDKEIVSATENVSYTAVFTAKQPVEAVRANAPYWVEGSTISYTEDTSKLPAGTTSGFDVNIPTYVTDTPHSVINTLNGNFEAGKTYRVTVKMNFYTIGWWYNLDYNIDSNVWENLVRYSEQIASWGAKTAEFTIDKTMVDSTTSIKITLMLQGPASQSAVPLAYAYSIDVAEVTYHTVTWVDEDGSELEVDQNVEFGTTPTYDGETPTKAADGDVEYLFAGWTPEVGEITGDTTYTATYKIVYPYEATGFDSSSSNYMAGVTYRYTTDASEIPTGATSAFVVEGTYSNNIYNVKHIVRGDFKAGSTYRFTIRTAEYNLGYIDETTGETVAWSWSNYPISQNRIDWTGACGTGAHLGNNGITAARTSAYTSGGLSHDIEVTEDCEEMIFTSWIRVRSDSSSYYSANYYNYTFKMSYNIVYEEVIYHTVTWVDEDGSVLETDDKVEFGTTPTYDSEIPTKESDGEYEYVFAGWTPTVSAITGDTVYTATYKISYPYEVTYVSADEAVTYTYTTDADLLPSGATSAFVAEGTCNTNRYIMKHVVRGDFKAGTTYKFTFRSKVFTVEENAYYDYQLRMDWTGASGVGYYLGSNNSGDVFTTNGTTYEITVSEDCEELIFTTMMRSDSSDSTSMLPYNFKIAFNMVYEEVVATEATE